VIDYIVHGADGVYLEKIPFILGEIGAGVASADVLLAALDGKSVPELETRVRKHEDEVTAALMRNANFRGPCPSPYRLSEDWHREVRPIHAGSPSTDEMKPLLAWLRALPRADRAYPRWYPRDVTARAR
jgi:hypothetical protein